MLWMLKTAESLKLSSIVCVFDQAIYSKAIEIKWKEKEKLKNTVLMMGMFHTIMVYMHILSKSFLTLVFVTYSSKVALLQRDLSIKLSVERCTIEALEHTS